MTDLENNIKLKKSGLTLEIKVKHRGQVPEKKDFLKSTTLNMLDSTPRSSQYSRHTAGDKKGHTKKVYDLEIKSQPPRSRVCFQHF